MFLGTPMNQNIADPQSLNSYSYSGDNPISQRDPTGKASWLSVAGEVTEDASYLNTFNNVFNAYLSNGPYSPYSSAYSTQEKILAANKAGISLAEEAGAGIWLFGAGAAPEITLPVTLMVAGVGYAAENAHPLTPSPALIAGSNNAKQMAQTIINNGNSNAFLNYQHSSTQTYYPVTPYSPPTLTAQVYNQTTGTWGSFVPPASK